MFKLTLEQQFNLLQLKKDLISKLSYDPNAEFVRVNREDLDKYQKEVEYTLENLYYLYINSLELSKNVLKKSVGG